MNTYASIGMNFGGVILGGLITWVCSRHYYRKAGKELKEEAAKLRHLNNLILCALENAGLATVSRDTKGNPLNLTYNLGVHSGSITLSGSVAGVTEPRQKP